MYALELWEDENIQTVVNVVADIGEAAIGVWNVTSSTAVEIWETESVQYGVNMTVDLGYKIGEVAVDVWESESVQTGLNVTVDMTYDLGYKLGGAAVGICDITGSAAVYMW